MERLETLSALSLGAGQSLGIRRGCLLLGVLLISQLGGLLRLRATARGRLVHIHAKEPLHLRQQTAALRLLILLMREHLVGIVKRCGGLQTIRRLS